MTVTAGKVLTEAMRSLRDCREAEALGAPLRVSSTQGFHISRYFLSSYVSYMGSSQTIPLRGSAEGRREPTLSLAF